jgi:hypothetical protein
MLMIQVASVTWRVSLEYSLVCDLCHILTRSCWHVCCSCEHDVCQNHSCYQQNGRNGAYKLFLFRLAPNMANQLTFLIVVNGPGQGIVPLNLWQKPRMQSELG